jgi:transglutaminase-like putative cysteine protease
VIYKVRHRTTYRYEDVVTFARCVLRLTPQSSAAQTVLENAIAITPQPSQAVERTGPFGEQMLTLVIDQPHRVLIIETQSRVDLHAAPIESPKDSPAWEQVRALSFESAELGADSPATYLYPTARTPILPAITDYAREGFPQGRPIIEAVAALMTRLRSDFTYDAKATDVSTPPGEAFVARRGVCQDFTHIMISGLRGLGLPAAYVSGYLRTIPSPGRPRLEGGDATHAWVLLWCGEERGWIGFDPTNALLVQDDHITLAIGRDYADIAPIDGVMLATGEQALKVEVDVVQEDEPGVRPAFSARVNSLSARGRR